ncbi:MAG: HTH-type transcriptional repressor YtrA [Candidatus Erwinia impunctatus]|nr:HTH-type transcriptional repressor YtrA [Culicoides impunctatus]
MPAPKETRYSQLAETLTELIHQGTFQPGSQLPAVRRCAGHYQVSINTVLSAYRLLEDQGLI